MKSNLPQAYQRDPTIISIGKRIRERRKALRLTQEQAAERCDLSPQFFACLERGSKSVRAGSIIKLSKGLDISSDYILFGKLGEPERHALLQALQCLDEVQSNHLTAIVRSYIASCTEENSKM